MNENENRKSGGPSVWLAVAAVLLGAALLGSGALAWAGWPSHGFGQRHGRFQHSTPEEAREHMSAGAEWVLRYVGASDEQRAEVDAILEQSIGDLFGLKAEHERNRDALIALLHQPEIDRDALEQIRVSEIDLADRASQQALDAFVDLAQVLTPEQRAELIELGERFRH
jgi:Spy/CpxP family protein refolding chaperone